jgi:hypothetical protein
MKIFPVPPEHKLQFSPEEIGIGDWGETQKGLLETRGVSTCVIVAAYNGDKSAGYLGHFTDLSGTEFPEAERNRLALSEMLENIKQKYSIESFEFWLGGAGIKFNDETYPDVQYDRDYTIQKLLEEGANERKIMKRWIEQSDADISVKLNSANGVLMVQQHLRDSP